MRCRTAYWVDHWHLGIRYGCGTRDGICLMPLYPNTQSYFLQVPEHGLLGASASPWNTSSSTIMGVAGRLELSRLRLPFPSSVTNIVMTVTTAGGTLTSGQCFAALYTGAGALVGVTATQHTAWESTGAKTMALASGPFACAAGLYYVGYWYNGTTAPTFRTAVTVTASHVNLGFSAPNLLAGTADTGLTTTAPATFGAQTSGGSAWWVGLS